MGTVSQLKSGTLGMSDSQNYTNM